MSDQGEVAAGIVLVHGACHTSACWVLTVNALTRRAPDVPVIAVDLPGRGHAQTPLPGVTIAACVDEVVHQVEESGLDKVVLVGHSLAGVILPGVAVALGADRVQSMVFLACSVPPEGGAVTDVLRGPLRWIAELAARRRSATSIPTRLALAAFGNGMNPAQHRLVTAALCPDAGWLTREPVSRRELHQSIPRTWILTRRDRAMTPAQQRRSIANLGGVQQYVELDAPHDAMVSHPEELALMLLWARAVALQAQCKTPGPYAHSPSAVRAGGSPSATD